MLYIPETQVINNKTYYTIPLDTFKGYVISEGGEILSNKTGEWIKKQPTKQNGYFMFCLTSTERKEIKDYPGRERNIQNTFALHRLLYMSIVSGPLERNIAVDHINNNKSDNRLCNLQLLTIGDNLRKSISTITEKQVKEVLELLQENKYKISKIAKMLGISAKTVSNIKCGYSFNNITGLPKKKKSYYIPKIKTTPSWGEKLKMIEDTSKNNTAIKKENNANNKKLRKEEAKQNKLDMAAKKEALRIEIEKNNAVKELEKYQSTLSDYYSGMGYVELKRLVSRVNKINLSEAVEFINKNMENNKLIYFTLKGTSTKTFDITSVKLLLSNK